MKAAFLGRLVGALVAGVALGLLVHYGSAMEPADSVDYSTLTREELLERLKPEVTPMGEGIAIGLGLVGFLFLVVEFFGFLFAQIAGSVTPPPPPSDLPSLRDENF